MTQFIRPLCYFTFIACLIPPVSGQDIRNKVMPNPYLKSRVGDWVEMESTSYSGNVESVIQSRVTITEKTDKQITITTSATFENGEHEDFLQVIDLSKPFILLTKLNYEPPGFAIVENSSGIETLETNDRRIETRWSAYSLAGNFGNTKKKVWYSDAIPVGGLVRETVATPYGHRSNKVLVDWGFADPNDERATQAGSALVGVSSNRPTAVAPPEKRDYTMLDLGTLGGDISEARGLNNVGAVVGFSENAEGIKRAFYYRDGKMIPIEATEALGVNDDGEVVGSVPKSRGLFGSKQTDAFRWTPGGGLETGLIPRVNVGLSPKELTGHARAINRDGDIVMMGQGIQMYALLRKSTGQSVDLGHLGGMVSIPYDINDKQEVVGYTKVGRTNVHGFLYRNGSMIDLGSLGRESGAHGVNNKSEVVGSSKDNLARFRAFRWAEGRMESLGTLGAEASNARAINDHSWIVGNAETANGNQHGFLYADGEMLDLNELVSERDGWEIVDAYAINESHQIAAVASRNGFKHAVLLSLASEKETVDDAAVVKAAPEMLSNAEATANEEKIETRLPKESRNENVDFFTSDAKLLPMEISTVEAFAGQAPIGFKAIDVFATASPDFKRVAFTAESEGERERCAVIDGEVSPVYSIVNEIKFSPNSERYTYIAHPKDGSGALLNVDGELRKLPGTSKDLQFTPDSQHLVYVSGSDPVMRNDGRAQWMEVPARVYFDHQPQRQYGLVGKIRVGNDSQAIAFSAMNQGRPVAVVDGKAVGTYTAFPRAPFSPAPLLSPDGKRSLFVAKRSGDWFVVIDGQESRRTYSEVGNLSFSPDSKRYGYSGKNHSKENVLIDGEVVGPSVKAVLSQVVFSPDGQRSAVAVSTEEGATIMVDGQLQETFDVIGLPVFSPNSHHLAFYGEKGDQQFIVCDQLKSPAYDDLSSDLVFSPDSTKLAYIVKQNDKQVLMVNQEKIDEAQEVSALSVTFAPDSKSIAYWAKRDGKSQICVNGVSCGISYDEVVDAKPQVLDFDDYQVHQLIFASPSEVRAAAMNKEGKFFTLTARIDPENEVDKLTFVASVSRANTDRYAILTRDADLKDADKTLGTAEKGLRFKIEDQKGKWIMGTFDIQGKPVRSWVSSAAVRLAK